ncbi:hypothetical protein L7F22_009740 [Adiantum nelumboides]|nr:hypothetical protein [Adiantum nelumboides]
MCRARTGQPGRRGPAGQGLTGHRVTRAQRSPPRRRGHPRPRVGGRARPGVRREPGRLRSRAGHDGADRRRRPAPVAVVVRGGAGGAVRGGARGRARRAALPPGRRRGPARVLRRAARPPACRRRRAAGVRGRRRRARPAGADRRRHRVGGDPDRQPPLGVDRRGRRRSPGRRPPAPPRTPEDRDDRHHRPGARPGPARGACRRLPGGARRRRRGARPRPDGERALEPGGRGAGDGGTARAVRSADGGLRAHRRGRPRCRRYAAPGRARGARRRVGHRHRRPPAGRADRSVHRGPTRGRAGCRRGPDGTGDAGRRTGRAARDPADPAGHPRLHRPTGPRRAGGVLNGRAAGAGAAGPRSRADRAALERAAGTVGRDAGPAARHGGRPQPAPRPVRRGRRCTVGAQGHAGADRPSRVRRAAPAGAHVPAVGASGRVREPARARDRDPGDPVPERVLAVPQAVPAAAPEPAAAPRPAVRRDDLAAGRAAPARRVLGRLLAQQHPVHPGRADPAGLPRRRRDQRGAPGRPVRRPARARRDDPGREHRRGMIDLATSLERPPEMIPQLIDEATALPERYRELWDALHTSPVFAFGDRYRVEGAIRELNDLGFAVDEVSLLPVGDGRSRLHIAVGDRNYHSETLRRLTGVGVGEGQARILLGDLNAHRDWMQRRTGHPVSERAAARSWIDHCLEPGSARAHAALGGAGDPVQAYCDLLEVRWLLSERAGADVGNETALAALGGRAPTDSAAKMAVADAPTGPLPRIPADDADER